MRLVLIKWVDSYSGSGAHWRGLQSYTPRNLLCSSVGWLLHDGEECKVVVPHLSEPAEEGDDRQGCGDMTIPTSTIIDMVDLSQPATNS